jgi:hypothetical protein
VDYHHHYPHASDLLTQLGLKDRGYLSVLGKATAVEDQAITVSDIMSRLLLEHTEECAASYQPVMQPQTPPAYVHVDDFSLVDGSASHSRTWKKYKNQFFDLGQEYESHFPPFFIYRPTPGKPDEGFQLFKPATFGSALTMSKNGGCVLLARVELCYPVRTPLDIWDARKKNSKDPKPDAIFPLHRRVFLQAADHQGIRKSRYDFDHNLVPTQKALDYAQRAQKAKVA